MLAPAVLVVSGLAVANPQRAVSLPATTGGWTVYHGDPAGTGAATSVAGVNTSVRVWTSPRLDGQLYGEPLVANGRVYVATENDTVYALDSTTGAVVWSDHLGTPVPASDLPCGDIQPTVGITGTPVIDPVRDELFAVADELVDGSPAHLLVGINTASGTTELSRDVDPSGSGPAALLQRTGLTLDDGNVVFGFGGNDGDCSTYRGWVVTVAEAGGPPVDFGVDAGPGESQGAVWMGGAAPAVDSHGDIWVGVGNGSVTSSQHAYDNSDSVLELSPSLQLLQYFAPTSWPSDNAHDLDLSMEPVLLADGQVLIAGKARIVYLLDGSHLGGIGGEQASLASICSEDVDGGSALVGDTVYLPCLSGIVAVRVGQSPASLTRVWSSGTGGGPPVAIGGLIWTIGQNGMLYGLDPTTGGVAQQASVGVPSNHFPTPGLGDGLLLVPASDTVVAFATTLTGGPTPTPTPTTSGRPAPAAIVGGSGGLSAGAVAALVVGGLVVVGLIGWLLWWRRRPGTGRSA